MRRLAPRQRARLVPRVTRGLAVRSALLGLVTLAITPASASTLSHGASARDQARVSTCTAGALRVLTWSDFATYGARSPVVITTLVRNVGRTTCRVALGATSPQVSVTSTSRGVTWRSCGTTPCPFFLVLVNLAAGTSVTRATTWNQRLNGHLAPRGTYRVSSRLGATTSLVATTIDLATANAQRTALVHFANASERVAVAVGARIVLNTTQRNAYVWSRPMSGAATLATLYARGGTTATAFFRATRAGSATITVTATPRCYPLCLAASRLYRVYVTVT